jgi:hypothetical protein
MAFLGVAFIILSIPGWIALSLPYSFGPLSIGYTAITTCLGAGLLITPVYLERKRATFIRSHSSQWGADVCERLVARRIETGMTKEMVSLSLGTPSDLDEREVLQDGTRKERWIYGRKRHGAAYIWFKGDQVVKLKQ